VQNLVGAIRKLRDDPVLRQEISVRARALFEAEYQVEINIDLWEKILTSIVVLKAHMAEGKIPVDVGTMGRGFAHEE
jgi:hypothetical protein